MRTPTSAERTGDARLLAALLGLVVVASLLLESPPSTVPARVSFPAHRVHVNTAPEHELRALPGVGEVLAGRIVAERAKGPFRCPEDLLRVYGIGDVLAARIAPHAVFGEDRGPHRP